MDENILRIADDEFRNDILNVKVLVSSGGFIPVIMVEKWEPIGAPVFAIMYLLESKRMAPQLS